MDEVNPPIGRRNYGAVARLSRRAQINTNTGTTLSLLDSRATAPEPPGASLRGLNKGEKLTILRERWLAAVYSVTVANVYRFLIDTLEKNISPSRENTS